MELITAGNNNESDEMTSSKRSLMDEVIEELFRQECKRRSDESPTDPDRIYKEEEACAAIRLFDANRELEQLVNNVEEKLAEPAKSKFKQAQTDWKKYFDSQASLMDDIYRNSENVDPAAEINERFRMIQQRKDELKGLKEMD